MLIEDTFRVALPIEDAWKILLDVERIAPCMPGAELQEIEGDEYRGVGKVKVGPITAQYKGAAVIQKGVRPRHPRAGQRQRHGDGRPGRRGRRRDPGEDRDRPDGERQGRPVRAGRDAGGVEQAARTTS
jgi:hypothetical protein